MSQNIPKTFGISIGEDTYIYPIIKYLDDKGSEVHFVNSLNYTAIYEDESFEPEMILLIDICPESDEYECYGNLYSVQKKINDNCYIMVRK